MSAGHAPRANPRIAVAPGPAGWAAEAIRSGGGEAVTLDDDPVGLVWTGGIVPEELRGVLAAHPEIVWVQLPLAGVEALTGAGVIDRQRQWTSAKGAFAEPVAEHALALLLAGLRQLAMRARARSWGEEAGATLFDEPVTIVGAGGLVDWSTGERARQKGMSLRKALVAHEATAILEACGDAMVTGPTQTNANDLVLILIR